jgi:hypothetical protein
VNKQDQVSQKLLDGAWVEVTCANQKYRKFQPPYGDDFYFVGKKGGLRIGKTLSNSTSARIDK